MRLDTPRARLDLAKHEAAQLQNACHTRLKCLDGTAWVTMDNDRRDIVLSRGDSFVVDSGERVIVSALGSGTIIDVFPQGRALSGAAPQAARPSAGRTWTGWLRGALRQTAA
jgi:hypothetical protein